MPAPSADEAILTFQSSGYSGELRVLGFNGTEGLSELFHFGVQLAATDNEIDLDAVVGRPAQLAIRGPEGMRPIHGIISRFEQGTAGHTFTPYFAELVPTVWLLTQRAGCRIFQNLTAPDIIGKVLKAAAIPSDQFRLALQRSDYVRREYCVQYRETDWNFISRLMEEEGIFHFFEHDSGKDVLVMADSAQVHVPIAGTATVVYRDPSGLVEVEEFIHDFRFSQQIRPGKVTLRDFNFERPTLDLTQPKTASRDTALEIYDYPALYLEKGPGGTLAQLRSETMQARRLLGTGRSVCRRLIPGFTCKLGDHPRADLNQEYIILWVQHEGTQPLGQDEAGGRYNYSNQFRCIPATVPFRPLRRSPKPVVEGSQTAIVTGPAGEEIHTDKYGRVKVHFHWDREGKSDDTSSCWVRVAQLWAGAGWGAMFIPRVGHEVIVDFLEGDPDRPIVTGRVYNGDNMPPYPLDAEKTKSTIKSDSSKGGGGFNEYRFEDKKGSEEIYQHAQKDLTIVTENDKNQKTGHDETLKIGHDRRKTVGNDETTSIGADRSETVGNNETISIGKDRTETVGQNETITIVKDRTETVGGNETITIIQNRVETVGVSETVTIGAARTLTVGASDTTTVGGGWALSVGGSGTMDMAGSLAAQVGKNNTCDAGESIRWTAGKEITLTCGKASIVLKKDGTITINGKDITVKGSGKINVKASKNVVIKGQKILEN